MTPDDKKRAVEAVDTGYVEVVRQAFLEMVANSDLGEGRASEEFTRKVEVATDARMVALAAIEVLSDVQE